MPSLKRNAKNAIRENVNEIPQKSRTVAVPSPERIGASRTNNASSGAIAAQTISKIAKRMRKDPRDEGDLKRIATRLRNYSKQTEPWPICNGRADTASNTLMISVVDDGGPYQRLTPCIPR